MGKSKKSNQSPPSSSPKPPELAKRRQNHNSTFKMGRTIGAKRERLETANERAAARKKDKQRQARRVTLTIFGFIGLTVILLFICFLFVGNGEPASVVVQPEEEVLVEPTVEIIDEDANSGSKISNRMRSYIGQAERDFRDLSFKPVKAVIPTGAIREVDFYLEGYTGFIKLHLDRDTAVSVEDAERMIRYLANQGINDFQYIDVRIAGKAYWK